MNELWIWLGAVALYVAFRLWYDGWRGPLRPEEIASYMERLEPGALSDPEELEIIRRFLEEDDGREFIMLNLVRLNTEPGSHPETGERMSPAELLQGYLGTFIPKLVRRAGHPLLQARKVGGYVDSWNVEPDPGWSFMGYVRYRSRRDLAALAASPEFLASHPFKAAAMANTFNFPTQPMITFYAGPRVWVALLLALAAALTHLVLLQLG
jgi:hypothetical protein